MKTLVSTLVLSLSVAGMSQAQTIIYSQDFENNNGNLPDSEIVVIDGDNCNVPSPYTVYDFWNLGEGTVSGDSGMYVYTGFTQSQCTANDWLMFDTLIRIPATHTTYLKYGVFTTAAADYQIYLSANGASVSNFQNGNKLFDTLQFNTNLNYIIDSIPLTAFAGQTAYIAFHNTTVNGGGFYIDDVQIIHHAIVNVDKTESAMFQCYPNPAHEVIVLQTEQLGRVEVYNVLGQMVKQQQTTSLQSSLYVGDLGKGIYVVKFNTGAGIYTQQLHIE